MADVEELTAVAVRFLTENGMTAYSGHKALDGLEDDKLHFFRGQIIPNEKAVRCMILEHSDGTWERPVLVLTSDRKKIRKALKGAL